MAIIIPPAIIIKVLLIIRKWRLTEWILACDRVRHRTSLALANAVDSNDAELVVCVRGESRQSKHGGGNLGLVAGPRLSGHQLVLNKVAGDGRTPVVLWSGPGQCHGALGDIHDLWWGA